MTRTTYPRSGLVIGAVLSTALISARAQAQGDQPQAEAIDRTPVSCVVVNRVARNVAVNDRQVVFFMKGGEVFYRNDLDGACQSLSAGDTRLVFHFRNSGSAKMARLCDTDSMTVERQTSRLGCGLGKFTPITAAEAAQLAGQTAAAAAPPASNSGNDPQRSDGSARRERN